MTIFKRHTNQWEKLIHHICYPHKEVHIFFKDSREQERSSGKNRFRSPFNNYWSEAKAPSWKCISDVLLLENNGSVVYFGNEICFLSVVDWTFSASDKSCYLFRIKKYCIITSYCVCYIYSLVPSTQYMCIYIYIFTIPRTQ
jgi:hypothetical protein